MLGSMSIASPPPGIWVWPELHPAQRSVLLEVLVHGSRSRADLARRTGLSRATLSRLTRDLVDFGFVSEGETQPTSGRGRPSETLHLRADSAHFAGIKLTGDALYAVVTDLHAHEIESVERPLESRDTAAVVAVIADVVAGFRERFPRLSAVGVCLAGDVEDSTGSAIVVGSHFLGWDEEPVQRLVEDATGLPAAVSNDVQALTAAHHWFGAAVGARSFCVIGLGAGIGAGIFVNDELVRGSRGHAGKVGHVFVHDSGPLCDRGHAGCASAYVTIPAMLANSGAVDFDDLIARVEAGDAAARRTIDEAGYALGVVVANLSNLVDPERVIITGEGLAVARIAEDSLRSGIADRLDPAAEPVELEVRDFRFEDYAWAAAVSSIRHIV